KELVDFTRIHFATEDHLMKTHHYPDHKKHRKEHRLLLEHMDALLRSVTRGKQPHFYSDYDVSSDWAIAHIIDFDHDLGEYLNSVGVH
ncbi:MAG: hemerythrin family protein, partial [Gammaproteobacteria bacterium]|nr:hemerythrin family protein [Gammaproteobacteria bacterium]